MTSDPSQSGDEAVERFLAMSPEERYAFWGAVDLSVEQGTGPALVLAQVDASFGEALEREGLFPDLSGLSRDALVKRGRESFERLVEAYRPQLQAALCPRYLAAEKSKAVGKVVVPGISGLITTLLNGTPWGVFAAAFAANLIDYGLDELCSDYAGPSSGEGGSEGAPG